MLIPSHVYELKCTHALRHVDCVLVVRDHLLQEGCKSVIAALVVDTHLCVHRAVDCIKALEDCVDSLRLVGRAEEFVSLALASVFVLRRASGPALSVEGIGHVVGIQLLCLTRAEGAFVAIPVTHVNAAAHARVDMTEVKQLISATATTTKSA